MLNYFCFSQSDVPLTLRAQFNGSYGYTIIGNTMNEFDNWQNPSPPCQMFTQSSAILNLLPNQNIVAAYLHWSSVEDGNFNPIISLNGVAHSSNNTSVSFPENNIFFSYFGSFVNVTTQVQNTGNAMYTLSNIDLNPIINLYCSNAVYHLGWSIIIVYQQIGLPNVQLNVYDGFSVANTYFNNGVTNFAIDNLNVIDTNNAQMTYTAFNGSNNNFFDEFIKLNSNTLSNALNPPNNPFNSTNSFTGSTSFWNMDIDTFDISAYVNIGDIQANISFGSGFQRFIQTLVTSIRSELPDATVQINQITGQEVCNNRNLTVNYTVANTNSNAVLQVVPVSFYANGVLLQTVNTPSPVVIGGNLTLQTTVVIPSSISSPFDLKVVVDNNATNASTIAESNENNNSSLQTISLLNDSIIPTFNIANNFCQNATVPVLPTTSINSISGTWLPNVINNQASEVYVFTPNAGQCAVTYSLNIIVTPSIIPTFNIANNFCQNATVSVLSTTSINSISGTWLPNVINNQASGVYVFTPNAGQCAANYNLNVTIQNASISNENLFICDNESGINNSIVLNSKLNASKFNFVWTLNGLPISQNTSLISVNQSGNYQLVATSILGNCSQIFNFNVLKLNRITADYSVSNDFEQDATITLNASGGSGQYSYSFNNLPFSDNPFYEVQEGGDIVVKIKDNSNCDVVSKTITVWQYPRFFTPNNDATNDVWGIFTKKDIKIDIFDRFGKLLKQIKTGEYWNGTFKEQLLPATDYWFVVNYDDNKTFRSHFALKR
jgi:gliding motility-associated-like protein